MIKSMTGYGRADMTVDGRHITLEIKSVNHRYFEFTARTSRGYSFLEEKLKQYISEKVSRGKVDVYVSIESIDNEDAQVLINHSIASGYVKALNELSDTYNLSDNITVNTLAGFNDIFTVHKAAVDEEAVWQAVKEVADKALESFIAMRELEGAKLKDDIKKRAAKILDMITQIERRWPQIVVEYNEKLKARLSEVLKDIHIDEQRLLTEAAIYADKIAVAEETVRLRSHFDQLYDLLQNGQAVGRKMDFLVQEINREVNTIGSKIQDIEAVRIVIDIKAEMEKIREQIQNIE